ncbi:hypothetical protein F66182_9434 [Fusarium sp. NRRL 66182]|nr:hypothetical protein F66182_9434 [Fusarium sp. NRRL 66182]
MKGTILSLLTSGAAAQITLGPALFQYNAIDPSDPEYTTCQQVQRLVEGCVSSLGGLEGAATADPDEIISCACCDGRDNAAPLYSVCSDYLDEEGAENTSQYEAYGTLYSACRLGATCTGGGGANRPTATPTETETEDEDDISTITSGPASQQTYASACGDMLDLYGSCTSRDRDFTDLPLREQAECLCCRGSGDNLSWTDAMGDYASTCADWARTGEPEVAYAVARTLATICNRFSDACEAPRTAESGPSETEEATSTEDDGARTTSEPTVGSSGGDDDDDNSGAGAQTTTVTVPPASETADSGNDASSARVGFGAVFAAVAALAIAL